MLRNHGIFDYKIEMGGAPTPSYPTDGLIYEFKLEQNITDTAPFSHTATNTNMVYNANGKVGYAGEFASTGSTYFTLDLSFNQYTLGRNAFTVCQWIYPHKLGGCLMGQFAANSDGRQENHGIWIAAAGNDNLILGDRYGVGYRNLAFGKNDISTNVWTFLVSGYDGNKTFVKLYKSDRGAPYLDVSLGSTLGMNNNTDGIRIGRNIALAWTTPFDGLIDQWRFYNRTLSDAEILQLYNNGNGI